VVLLPLPRLNAILLAAPRARVDDVVKEIKRLDRPTAAHMGATAFPLKKASAARVASLVQQFYAQRYPGETGAQNQVRVTIDDSSNTVYVQAAPGDLNEIRNLITRVDSSVSSAVNDLRVVQLRNTIADELAGVVQRAISEGVAPASATAAPSIVPALPGAAQPGGLPGAGAAARPAAAPGTTTATKTTALRFISGRRDGAGTVQAGLLEDVYVLSEARTNSLILSAPPQTMDLLLALVRELDVVSSLRSRVNIFTLRRSDAAITAATLQQLFFGGATGRTGTGGAGGGGILGGGGGGFPGGGAGGATGTTAAVTRPVFTLGDVSPEGTPIIALRFTVDDRTNSLIVSGSENDLRVIEALISRLEDSDVEARHNEVFKLHNAAAADVATALQNFWTRSLQVLSGAQQLSAYQEIQRDVVVVAEPVSNTLLVSATPRYFADILHLIQGMDAAPAQVVVQVLVAEVDLNNSEEFGVELGLQSPVLFNRSVVPSPNGFGSGTVNYTNATGSVAPPGVTVNNSINPFANPGFNFNNPSVPLGNNPLVDPGVVGFQSLSSLGVGRTSSQSNLGGFVFSAQSGIFNVLVRALKLQGRIDILSRPQLTTLDNQTALINIGQNIPIIGSTSVTGTGTVIQSVIRQNVGVILQVTPRISPDGTVLMRVVPEVSSVAAISPATGNGSLGATLNIQHLETTILARDGETVAIGGMIQKIDNKNENKVPVLGDLPYIGAAFRYRTQFKTKTELLIIMTPHIIRSPADAHRILAEEANRIDWILGDVKKIHGDPGLDNLFPHSAGGGVGGPDCPSIGPALPVPGTIPLPAPRPVPPQPGTAPGVSVPAPAVPGPSGSGNSPSAGIGPALPAAPVRPPDALATTPEPAWTAVKK
jgi:type II secretion system protein D